MKPPELLISLRSHRKGGGENDGNTLKSSWKWIGTKHIHIYTCIYTLRIRTLKNKGFEGTNIYKPLLQRGGVFFFDLTTFPSHMHEAAHEAAIEGHRDSWSNALVKRSVRPSVFFRSAGFSRRTIVLRLCSNTRLFPFYKMVDLTFRVMTSTHVTQVWVDLRKSGE